MNLNLDSLKEQVSNLSLYDLKAGVRKVQNAVMNYTEMEAKVNKEYLIAESLRLTSFILGSRSYQ